MIEKHYINQVKKIADKFNSLSSDIDKLNILLVEKQNILLNLKSQLDNLDNFDTDLVKQNKYIQIMSEYDKDILSIENKLLPILSEIEKIKKDMETTYNIIKNAYPTYSDEQLQKMILTELNGA